MSGRYDSVPIASTTVPDGTGGLREVRYLRRRALPDPRDILTAAVHRVTAADRLDLVSHRYLGDPTAWWRIADANGAVDPDELTGPDAEGDLIVIPLPGV
ncbi:LysM domain-containing protein [Nonomuraea sp. B1E8]|uniref:LysM domain-containing protein n=1 Tax=unclassified Nonomuraea TaxID=2593643 RepID=UPI00325F1143